MLLFITTVRMPGMLAKSSAFRFRASIVVHLVQRYDEVILDERLCIVAFATRHNLVGRIGVLLVILEVHVLVEVEADAEAHVLTLLGLIEEDVVVPATLVYLLLLPLGDAVALLLQRLHPGLHLLACHALVIDLIEIGVFLGAEVGEHDLTLRGELGDVVLVVDDCGPFAFSEAAAAL